MAGFAEFLTSLVEYIDLLSGFAWPTMTAQKKDLLRAIGFVSMNDGYSTGEEYHN